MPPRVLIVDDSRLTRTIIRNAFASAGYEVVGEAVNGREGIELSGELKPDLVTVDFTMPEKGGLESIEEMLSRNPGGKILVVTALGSQKLLQEDAVKAGALAVVAKPFNPYQLLRTAESLLGRNTPKGTLSLAHPSPSSSRLTDAQINDLMEVGNIGAGNAASRLSDLIRQRCIISPPQVANLDPKSVRGALESGDTLLSSLAIRILGDIPAVMAVALRKDHALQVLKYITGGDAGAADGKPSAKALAALKHMGEFLTRAFSHAVNQFLLEHAKTALPEVVLGEAAEDLESLLRRQGGPDAGGSCLVIHCLFSDVDRTFEGKLAYILGSEAQHTVLNRIQALLSAPL